MNALEAELTYPWVDTLPEPGQSLELRPGVRWIRMALPFALNHINLWLLRDCVEGVEGWTVVDCCIDQPASRAQWDAVIATQLEGLPIVRVIATHMHPDHLGLAHWLCERFNARLWISLGDYNVAQTASKNTAGFGGERSAAFFQSHGLSSDADLAKIRARSAYYPSMVPALPPSYRRMLDGDVLQIGGRDWRCIVGYGHAPEHISLFCDDAKRDDAASTPVLISGDMLLPRISTNVAVYEMEPEGNPLPLFLRSLDRFLDLPENTLVLPSHGKPFRGAHKRVAQLHDHHRDRLAEVLEACATQGKPPQTAHDMLQVLFKRELDLHQTTFAMGESVAHLHALWHAGKLVRSKSPAGVLGFRAKL